MNRKRQKGYSLVALVEDDGDLDDPRQQVEMTVFDETIDLDRGGKRKRLGGSSGGSDEEESDADAADAPTGIVLSTAAPEETLPVTVLQVVFALLMAGAGLVCAGIWLDRAQHWSVYQNVKELLILYPALMGLKGNLEMTLSGRLSTAANLGQIDSNSAALRLSISNLCVMQVQAIVVGAFAALFSVVVGAIAKEPLNWSKIRLLIGSSVATASTASLLLGSFMCGLIVVSRRLRCNPDNFGTPIAASLSDLITLVFLSYISQALFDANSSWFTPLMLIFFASLIPICVYISMRDERSREVLRSGWIPIFLSMILSSFGGFILERQVDCYPGMAALQPVLCGVGGNVASIHASRVSTTVHRGDKPAERAKEWTMFFVLLFLVLPVQIGFMFLTDKLESNSFLISPKLLLTYVMAAEVHVSLLLLLAAWLVRKFWHHGLDPDDHALPYVTATGDIIGMSVLTLVFWINFPLCSPVDADDPSAIHNATHSLVNATASILLPTSSTLLPTPTVV